MLKHGSTVIAKPIANIFIRAITDQQILSQIGHGIIILLLKPGKLVGRPVKDLYYFLMRYAIHSHLLCCHELQIRLTHYSTHDIVDFDAAGARQTCYLVTVG